MPEPVTTAAAVAATTGFNWEQIAAAIGALLAVLGFLWKLYSDRKSEVPVGDSDIQALKQKQKDIEELIEKLQSDYSELKTDLAVLKKGGEATTKDIERLEGNIDRIIDMLIKALSEDKL